MHLRNTAQRICILHFATFAMRVPNRAALEQLPQIRRCLDLSGVRPRSVNSLVKRGIGPLQRVERKRSNHVGGIRQHLGREHAQRSTRQHRLCPVDERNRFLGFQHHRLNPSLFQGIHGRNAPESFLPPTFAFSHQR